MKIQCPMGCKTVTFGSRRTYAQHMYKIHNAYLHNQGSNSKKEFDKNQESTSSKTEIDIPTKETILNKIKYSSTQSATPLLNLNPSEAIKFLRAPTNLRIKLLPDMAPMSFTSFQEQALLYPMGWIIRKVLRSNMDVKLKTVLLKNITRKINHQDKHSWVSKKMKKNRGLIMLKPDLKKAILEFSKSINPYILMNHPPSLYAILLKIKFTYFTDKYRMSSLDENLAKKIVHWRLSKQLDKRVKLNKRTGKKHLSLRQKLGKL